MEAAGCGTYTVVQKAHFVQQTTPRPVGTVTQGLTHMSYSVLRIYCSIWRHICQDLSLRKRKRNRITVPFPNVKTAYFRSVSCFAAYFAACSGFLSYSVSSACCPSDF